LKYAIVTMMAAIHMLRHQGQVPKVQAHDHNDFGFGAGVRLITLPVTLSRSTSSPNDFDFSQSRIGSVIESSTQSLVSL
jgi:hypothetical protein